jgi:two-component system, NtrC family, sensor histidine kinase HydH
MARRVVWKIAAPMVGLGVFLLILGAFAAYNVHEQQRKSSEMVAHQANAMLAIHELNIVMREIRYQVNAFLRTHDSQHLINVSSLHASADTLLERTKRLAREGREHQRIGIVEAGYRSFFSDFQAVMTDLSTAAPAIRSTRELSGVMPVTPGEIASLTRISDDVLTNRVLKPLEESLTDNRRFVAETNQASEATAQHLKIGFLLLGICGAVAGLLLGTVIARTIGRSIVQLNVTVRGVAGRLSDVTGPVTFSHTGDLADINTSLRELERDIGEVVERLQQRETELLRSEQLAKVGQLAAGVAHELRNPLMPMKILVQAALERNDEIGLKGRSLQVVNEEIGRLERSIRSFLDYARPPTPEKTTLDVREVVTGTIDLVIGRARKQAVEIESKMPNEVLLAHIDRGQIRQLLLNLLLNALDALPEGGLIQCIVESNVKGLDSPLVPASNGSAKPVGGIGSFNEHDSLRLLAGSAAPLRKPARRWLALHVADNGPGIPKHMLSKIFDPFYTTRPPGQGTGLGLSICNKIMLEHNGRISVESIENVRTVFTLEFPMAGKE